MGDHETDQRLADELADIEDQAYELWLDVGEARRAARYGWGRPDAAALGHLARFAKSIGRAIAALGGDRHE